MTAAPTERGATATAAPRNTGPQLNSFPDHRNAALALLNSGMALTRKAGAFLGQLVADTCPLTPAQADWLAKLLERAGLPPLATGGRDNG